MVWKKNHTKYTYIYIYMHTLKRKKKEINLQPINKITSSTVHFFLFFFFFLFPFFPFFLLLLLLLKKKKNFSKNVYVSTLLKINDWIVYGHTNTWHEIAYKRKNGTQLILTPTRLLTSPANSSLSYRLIIGYVQTTINVPVHCESRIIITFQHYFEPWILSRGFQRSKEKKCDSLYVISFLFTGIEKVSWQECRAARWRRGGEGSGGGR